MTQGMVLGWEILSENSHMSSLNKIKHKLVKAQEEVKLTGQWIAMLVNVKEDIEQAATEVCVCGARAWGWMLT